MLYILCATNTATITKIMRSKKNGGKNYQLFDKEEEKYRLNAKCVCMVHSCINWRLSKSAVLVKNKNCAK